MNIQQKSSIRFALTILVAYLCIRYWGALERFVVLGFHAAAPLVLGAVIAYIVNILMSFYERKLSLPQKPQLTKLHRPICMLLAFLTLILVIVLLFRMILPELLNCLQLILEKLPWALRSTYLWMDEHFRIGAYLSEQSILSTLETLNIQNAMKTLVNFLMNGVGGAMGSLVSGVSTLVSSLATAFIAIVFAIYILVGKEHLGSQIHRLIQTYLGNRVVANFRYVTNTVDRCFHSFIVGQCLEAVILGSLCILGMSIFRFPYAMMIGCLVGFTALIPIAGAYIGAAVGAFMICTVNPLQAVLFIVFLLVLQQLEGNLIYPKVVGASIGLPGIFVLAAITIGGGISGIPGMLLGVPLTASVYQLLKRNMDSRNQASATEPSPSEQ